uniref:Uncharacterized protein n=1 Tax=Caulobacter sp. (strain K31) TaxID=366602 RepID=B0T7S9_CAUSK
MILGKVVNPTFQTLRDLEPIEPSQVCAGCFGPPSATAGRRSTSSWARRSNTDPTCCVLGYVHVTRTAGPAPVSLDPLLVSPSALDAAGSNRAANAGAAQLDVGRCLVQPDARHGLQTGDVVLMDSPSCRRVSLTCCWPSTFAKRSRRRPRVFPDLIASGRGSRLLFNAFSSREPVSASLDNALAPQFLAGGHPGVSTRGETPCEDFVLAAPQGRCAARKAS